MITIQNQIDQTRVGEIVFENEIYGFSDDPSKTVFLSNVSKSGATYPVSSNDGFSARSWKI